MSMSRQEFWDQLAENPAAYNITRFDNSSYYAFINGTWVDCEVADYITIVQGPKYLSPTIVIPITIIYITIFLTGVLGNVLVCVVICRNKMLQSVTNYYLFSLAVSDLMLLFLGLPNDLSVFWQQYPFEHGDAVCKIRALASEMSSYTSVLTIVAFTGERYMAICRPFQSYVFFDLHRAFKMIAAIWLCSFVCAVPFATFTKVGYIEFPRGSGNQVPESAFCAMLIENIPPMCPIYELSSLLFFVVPMIFILILYIRIGRSLGKRERHSEGTKNEGFIIGKSKHQSRKAIIKMLAAVVIAFFFCWAPFHAQRLLYIYARGSPYYEKINEWMYYLTGCLYYVSSTINPILYSLMSVKYRTAFKQILFGKKGTGFHGTRSSIHESETDIEDPAVRLRRVVSGRVGNGRFGRGRGVRVTTHTSVRVQNPNNNNTKYFISVASSLLPTNLFRSTPSPSSTIDYRRRSREGSFLRRVSIPFEFRNSLLRETETTI